MRAGRRQGVGPLESMAQAVAKRVIELVLEALDLNALLDRIDLNAVLDRIDLNAVIARVDLNAALAQVDLNQLLDQVDMNRLMARVDLTELIGNVDLEELADNSEFGAVISKSTSTVASGALDLVRSQAVGLDDFAARWVARLLRRRPYTGPPGPPELLKPRAQP